MKDHTPHLKGRETVEQQPNRYPQISFSDQVSLQNIKQVILIWR